MLVPRSAPRFCEQDTVSATNEVGRGTLGEVSQSECWKRHARG